MAAKFVILLSCCVSAIVAGPPATSYLPPGGPVVGRPVPVPAPVPVPRPVPVPITRPAPAPITRPSAGYLPPSGQVGQVPQAPVISRPIVTAPVTTGPAPRPISPVAHGQGRGHGHGYGHGPVVSSPIVRPTPVVSAPRPSVPVNTSPVRPGHHGGSYGSGYGSRTVGATAPY